MPQSTKIFGFLLFSFFVFITAKGELTEYLSLLGLGSGSTTNMTATSGAQSLFSFTGDQGINLDGSSVVTGANGSSIDPNAIDTSSVTNIMGSSLNAGSLNTLGAVF